MNLQTDARAAWRQIRAIKPQTQAGTIRQQKAKEYLQNFKTLAAKFDGTLAISIR
jgi:hypothetical protein